MLRRARLLAAVALLALGLAGCGAPAAPTPAPERPASAVSAAASPPEPPARPIAIAIPTVNSNLVPLRLAIAQGYYLAEGLDARLVQVGSSAFAPAMLSGEVDYASLFGATVRLAASGAPVKVVLVFTNKPLFYLVTQPTVARVEDLRGQPLAVGPRGGTLDHLAREIYLRYGLDPAADLVSRPFQDISGTVPALLTGQVQGAVVPLPFNLVAEAQGMRRLVDAADLSPAASGGVATTEQRLTERPDEVRAMLRATLRGMDVVRTNRAATVAELVDWGGMELPLAEGAYDAVLQTLTADGLAADAEIQPEIDNARQQMGTPDADVPISQVVDFGPLRAVLQERPR